MSVITLPFTLSNPDPRVPMVKNYQKLLSSLPSMHSWHSMRPEYLELDGNGRIASVVDRSGKGRTLSLSSTTYRPLYVADAINGKGAAEFNDSMLLYNGTFPTTAYTKLIVVKITANHPSGSIFGMTTTSQINHRVYYDESGGVQRMRHQVQNAGLGAGNTANVIGGTVPPGEYVLVKASFDGATGAVRCGINNGALTVTIVPTLTEVQDLLNFVGAGNGPSGIPSSTMDGQIADIIITNVDLFAPANSALAATYLQYFADIYGLPV